MHYCYICYSNAVDSPPFPDKCEFYACESCLATFFCSQITLRVINGLDRIKCYNYSCYHYGYDLDEILDVIKTRENKE